jgi:hypothetical protein
MTGHQCQTSTSGSAEVPDTELVPLGIGQHGPVMRLKILPPQDAGTQLHQAIDRQALIGHLHVHVSPVLTDLGLGHLLQEQPRLGAGRITQHGVTGSAVNQFVTQRGRPRIDHGGEIVPVQPDLANLVKCHPASAFIATTSAIRRWS